MAAWHATVIESIASKWGRVISIDADTLERNKFDYARVLLGVSSITDVPKEATVVLNGDKFFIRMSSSEFEDNRCWINGGSSVDSMDEEDSCRFEDLPRKFNEVEVEVSLVNGNIETDPKKLCTVGSPWAMENSGGTKLKDSKPQEVLETNEPKAVDHWNDVPIADGSNLSVPSSGFSESMGPVVDNETGLFTIKPRVLKNTQMISPCLLRPKEVKTKSQKALSYIALTQSGSKVIRAPQNYSSPKSTTIEVNVSASEGVAVKEDELEIEAAKCLEVCNVSGLYFKATNEEVQRRFKIMGKRDRSHRIIAAIYEKDQLALVPTNSKPYNKSWCWRGVTSQLQNSNSTYRNNIQFKVGNERRIKFWSDSWIGSSSLKDAFPRIFAISTNKLGVIANFGYYDNGEWRWRVNLRRQPFGWRRAAVPACAL
ncbi:hypothetical protein V6N13_001567 [Hibiscus sabdariffa]